MARKAVCSLTGQAFSINLIKPEFFEDNWLKEVHIPERVTVAEQIPLAPVD